MTTVSFWLIRHMPSGFYLPEPQGRMGRGGSHVEPADPETDRPRMCATELSAKRYLSSWLQGRFMHGSGYDSYNGEYYEDISVVPVPSRIRSEMEIVKIDVTVP